MSSQKFTDVAAYQAYVQEFASQLISAMFFGFVSGQVVTPHEGVKGKKTLTEITLSALSTRYGASFAPIADAIASSITFWELLEFLFGVFQLEARVLQGTFSRLLRSRTTHVDKILQIIIGIDFAAGEHRLDAPVLVLSLISARSSSMNLGKVEG